MFVTVILRTLVIFFDCYCNFICYRCNFQSTRCFRDIVVLSFCIILQLVSKCVWFFTYICNSSGYFICRTFAIDKSIAANCHAILVNAVPSYTFSASAVFKVTSLFVIVRFPSVTTNFTLLKFLLVFVKSDSFNPIA